MDAVRDSDPRFTRAAMRARSAVTAERAGLQVGLGSMGALQRAGVALLEAARAGETLLREDAFPAAEPLGLSAAEVDPESLQAVGRLAAVRNEIAWVQIARGRS